MYDDNTTRPAAPKARFPAHELRVIAAEAQVDPRSVARVLRGEHLRTSAAEARILAALRVHGLKPGEGLATSKGGSP
jgi:DNA-binding LacI/PurR family transcriptional regulator